MGKKNALLLVEEIQPRSLTVRGQTVILDTDLAKLYGVTTKRFNEQIRRNRKRFPDDFLFQLTGEEADALRSQFATSKPGRGGRRYLPYAFTEHGAIMAATVLNSPRAVEVSVFVVRAFVRLREFVGAHKELTAKLAELERTVAGHDDTIRQLVSAIRHLLTPAPKPVKGKIGFQTPGGK